MAIRSGHAAMNILRPVQLLPSLGSGGNTFALGCTGTRKKLLLNISPDLASHRLDPHLLMPSVEQMQ